MANAWSMTGVAKASMTASLFYQIQCLCSQPPPFTLLSGQDILAWQLVHLFACHALYFSRSHAGIHNALKPGTTFHRLGTAGMKDGAV